MKFSLQHPADRTPRLPWAGAALAFVALMALYLAGAHWVLVLSAVLLLAAQLLDKRFDNDSPLIRVGRYALFAALSFGAYLRFTGDTGGDSIEMVFAHTVGQFCAAELAIQAWLQRPTSGSRPPAAILLATMIFLSASNTFEPRFIPFLTPLFFGCLILALRDYAHPGGIRRSGLTSPVLAVLLVLTLGAGSHFAVYAWRNEISQWGMKYLEGKTVQTSGISTSPDLGRRFELRGGLTPMLHAEGLPAFSYLRAMSFSDYHSGRWGPLLEARRFQPISNAALKAGAQGRRAHIERLVDDAGMIFTPLDIAGLDGGQSHLEWQAELGPLRNTLSEDEAPPTYNLVLGDEDQQGPFCAPAGGPGGAPACYKFRRNSILAFDFWHNGLGAKRKTAADKVRAVEQYLISHHAYSFDAQPGSGDKVSDFLLKGRSAHCEFFASSAVLLLRCLGVPSRYVIGYLAHESEGKDALVVRGRDAHAWGESWVEGRWITVEATPGDGRPEGRAERLPLMLNLKEQLNRWLKTVRQELNSLRNQPAGLWMGAVGALFAWLMFSAWRRRISQALHEDFHYATRDEQLSQLSVRFERWLAKRGLPCPPSRTWIQHAHAVQLFGVLRFIEGYDKARFGAQTHDIRLLEQMLRDLEAAPVETHIAERRQIMSDFTDSLEQIVVNLQTVIRGKEEGIRLLLISMLAGGHTLLEDVPGTGKTTLAKSLARSIDGTFRRVQFTPDLLPADITGSSFYRPQDGAFEFRPGPVFANVLLADEINRTSPRTQSALLEVMSENQVTSEGLRRPLPQPFFVLATQNPLEFHGTYPLPEAQLDRFTMRITLGYPDLHHEVEVISSQNQEHPFEKLQPVISCEAILQLQSAVRDVHCERAVAEYIVRLVDSTRHDTRIKLGVSPRGSLALHRTAQARAKMLGRDFVLPDDVQALATPVLAHRLALDTKAKYSGVFNETIIEEALEKVEVPR